jgi:repressor LexA
MGLMITKRKSELLKTETIVLDKINIFIKEHGYPPTVRELQEICGFGSPSTAHSYLKRLEDKGLISRSKDMPRAMRVAK